MNSLELAPSTDFFWCGTKKPTVLGWVLRQSLVGPVLCKWRMQPAGDPISSMSFGPKQSPIDAGPDGCWFPILKPGEARGLIPTAPTPAVGLGDNLGLKCRFSTASVADRPKGLKDRAGVVAHDKKHPRLYAETAPSTAAPSRGAG